MIVWGENFWQLNQALVPKTFPKKCYSSQIFNFHPTKHGLRPGLVPKKFHPKLSHRILRHMHGVLNIDKKKLIVQFVWKSQDECFKTN